jgi:type VI protein secretion system component Hcp
MAGGRLRRRTAPPRRRAIDNPKARFYTLRPLSTRVVQRISVTIGGANMQTATRVARPSAWATGILAVLLALLSPPALGQAFSENIYVNIPDLRDCGPVTTIGHEKQFEALTLQEDISNGLAFSPPTSAKASVKTFTLTKAIDHCSTAILLRLLAGSVIPLMTVDFVRSDGVTFASLRLEPFAIADVRLASASNSPVEMLTIGAVGKLTFTVTNFKPDGSVGSQDTVCWDFIKNKKC